MKILLTGATGFIGTRLGIALAQKKHELIVVTRNESSARLNLPFPCEIIEGDLSAHQIKIPKVDAVIHLLGEPIDSGRWTKKQKKKIFDSRIVSTRNLKASLKNQDVHFISASATGFYGNTGDAQVNETSPAGADFLAQVCVDWEAAAKAGGPNFSVIRTGVVLGENGGALKKMAFPFRLGLGGNLGSGNQWMSWIHLNDLIRVYVWTVENKKTGIFNAVSPEPVTNKDFTKKLAAALDKSTGPAVPAVALKLALGQMSQVLLASQKVLPQRLIEEKFNFEFAHLDQALADICKHWRAHEDFFVSEQYIPKKVEQVFPFFSEVRNLEAMTPNSLQFKVLKASTENVAKGTLIDYQLKIRGVPVRWKTLIEDWIPGQKFVDTQTKGPYKLWHHTHNFLPLGPGVLMRDEVRYRVPLGLLGWLVAGFLVRKEVEQIFKFRRAFIQKKFGESFTPSKR